MTCPEPTDNPATDDPLSFAVVAAIILGTSMLCGYALAELLRRRDENGRERV